MTLTLSCAYNNLFYFKTDTYIAMQHLQAIYLLNKKCYLRNYLPLFNRNLCFALYLYSKNLNHFGFSSMAFQCSNFLTYL